MILGTKYIDGIKFSLDDAGQSYRVAIPLRASIKIQ